jgi:hypothetical protein
LLRSNQPRAVITNFANYVQNGKDDKELAKPIIDAKFACITECYLGDNPAAIPENMNGRAFNLGWAHSQPAFGVWNYSIDGYLPWKDWMPGQWYYVGENFIQ